jgi:formate dehydrogenase maturation protein FdhE
MENELLRIECVSNEHEDYQEYKDFEDEQCRVCGSKGHKKMFRIWWDDYGADIIHCQSCLGELRRKIDALKVLVEFGFNT